MLQEKEQNEVSGTEIVFKLIAIVTFLISKWLTILLIVIVAGVLGVLYAWVQKPAYVAEITFAPENMKSSGLGAYSALAAQFGVDMGGGGGSVFEGENLMLFLSSKMLVEKTLFSTVTIEGKKEMLINYYLRLQTPDERSKENKKFKQVSFVNYQPGVRALDSILNRISDDIGKMLQVEKTNKKSSIISAKIKSNDELFAKVFLEQLVTTGIQYYIDYRSTRSRENVMILQRQTDSVRRILTSNIVSVAASSDLNVNPIKMIVRTGTQQRQVDVQANGQLYGELVKQLELAKIALRKETPLIQILDTPRLPLEKKKLGRLKGGIIFGFIGGIVSILGLLVWKIRNNLKANGRRSFNFSS